VRSDEGGLANAEHAGEYHVGSGQTTAGYVQITLDPDHVFGKGLLLISLPDDFGGQDAASVLDQPALRPLGLLATATRTYAIYHGPPGGGVQTREGMLHGSTTGWRSPRPAPPPERPVRHPREDRLELIGSVRRTPIECCA